MEDTMSICGSLGGVQELDFYALFDGHGGDATARYAAAHLPRLFAAACEAKRVDFGAPVRARDKLTMTKIEGALCATFLELQARVEAGNVQGGAMALAAVVAQDVLFVANLGDCRALLVPRVDVARARLAAARKRNSGGHGSDERSSGDSDNEDVVQRVTVDHKPHLPAERKRIEDAGGMVTTEVTTFICIKLSFFYLPPSHFSFDNRFLCSCRWAPTAWCCRACAACSL